MSAPKLHWTAYLWPGLPHLWNRGSWAGLALAVGFTGLLNVWLLSVLVWREWLPAKFQMVGGVAIAGLWVLAWLEGRADWRRYLAELKANDGLTPVERSEQQYREAQQSYLAGDWVATEQRLLKLLKQDSRDVEARLLLATLWRRLDRAEDACRALDELERLESASQWQAEITAERSRLAVLADQAQIDQTQPIETERSETIETHNSENAEPKVAAEPAIKSKATTSQEPTILPIHGSTDSDNDLPIADTNNDSQRLVA